MKLLCGCACAAVLLAPLRMGPAPLLVPPPPAAPISPVADPGAERPDRPVVLREWRQGQRVWEDLEAQMGMPPHSDWLLPAAERIVVASWPAGLPVRRQWEEPESAQQPVLGERDWSVITEALRWKRQLAAQQPPPQARHLMSTLKAVFASEGVPAELVWIAEIESAFDVDAESSAGARGLFQFLPETAEHYGLRIGSEDERTDPVKAARAAARYLRFLHRRFGSWSLAVTAYNAGEGRVARLLQARAARSVEAILPHLPRETRSYLPRVVAALAVREKAILNNLPPPGTEPRG